MHLALIHASGIQCPPSGSHLLEWQLGCSSENNSISYPAPACLGPAPGMAHSKETVDTHTYTEAVKSHQGHVRSGHTRGRRPPPVPAESSMWEVQEHCSVVLPPQPLLNEHRGDRAIILSSSAPG